MNVHGGASVAETDEPSGTVSELDWVLQQHKFRPQKAQPCRLKPKLLNPTGKLLADLLGYATRFIWRFIEFR